tara:strand:- start:104531 stop:104962 length:432 start_codon:yes stop_codon:yes gene_type:complete
MNKLHKKIFFIYILGAFTYSFYLGELNQFPFISFIVGSFIFLSLHYVYLFSLVGISKKSISINILANIKNLSSDGENSSVKALCEFMNKEENGLDYIRENRLRQMELLNWAKLENGQYHLTPKGKLFNQMGNTVLKIWNLKRL